MENANTTWADHIEKPPPKEQGEEQNQIRTLAIFGLERLVFLQSWTFDESIPIAPVCYHRLERDQLTVIEGLGTPNRGKLSTLGEAQ